MISIGTSGFDYDDWRGFFYPDDLPKSEFLSYYANQFEALELNFSYYHMPSSRQINSMIERTDGKVEFSIKAHRSMTHDRTAGKLDYKEFTDAISPLREAGRLGAVLAQFPYSFEQNQENRSYIKRMADRMGPPLVVELRRKEWAADPIRSWLTKIGVGFCCVDEPKVKGLMPPIADATASPAYVRFHGRNAARWYEHNLPHERYDYRYRASELKEWVPKILGLESAVDKVLVFFNNHFQAKAVDGAKALAELLANY